MFSFVNNIHNSFVNPELMNNVQRNGVLYMQYFANDLSSTAEQYFLNMHISDICTNDLYKATTSCLENCRRYPYNKGTFLAAARHTISIIEIFLCITRLKKTKTKKTKTEPIYFFVLSYQVDCFCTNLGRERINI